MVLLPFFEIPYGDRLAKNVKKRYVQVIPRSTSRSMILALEFEVFKLKFTVASKVCEAKPKNNWNLFSTVA